MEQPASSTVTPTPSTQIPPTDVTPAKTTSETVQAAPVTQEEPSADDVRWRG